MNDRIALVLAFAAVWVIWGTTYLGIRVALETLPPFAMAGARFVLAGAAMLAWARWRAPERVRLRHWRNATWLGVLFFTVGTGAVVWAEVRIESGTAALLIAAEPVAVSLMARRRPSGVEAFGMALASVGVLFLVGSFGGGTRPDAAWLSGQAAAALVVLVGCLAWALASVQSAKLELPRSATRTAGMQMLSGGAALCMLSLVTGEWHAIAQVELTARAVAAFVYLVLFGSIVAFTAYQLLARRVRPALLSTYAYVNPIVAVAVGAWILGEAVTARMLGAGAAIVAGVFFITAGPHLRAAAARMTLFELPKKP